MNMVTNAANTNDLAARSIDQHSYIAMHTLQMLIGYLGAGGLHVEDDMQIYFIERLWHIINAFALTGRLIVCCSYPGRCPGLWAALALSGRHSASCG